MLLRHATGADAAIKDLKEFCANFDGVLAFHAGSNASIEPAVRHGFELGFVIDFESAADRDRYVVDPGHQSIGARLCAACRDGEKDIVVFDLDMSD